METYNIVPSQGGWGVSQNKNRPEGVTRSEKAHFEAVYLAAKEYDWNAAILAFT